jgi:hypothetical protein
MSASPSISLDRVARWPVPADPIDTVREMLSMLETLTIAGQHHVMEKVIGFAEVRIAREVRRGGAASRRGLWEQLDCLRREAGHIVPDVSSFARRGESLMALLAMLASPSRAA